MDTTQEIIEINKRITKTKEQLIRMQTKKESLLSERDKLVKIIKDAGYNPISLKDDLIKLKNQYEELKKDVEKKLEQAEKILKSLPE